MMRFRVCAILIGVFALFVFVKSVPIDTNTSANILGIDSILSGEIDTLTEAETLINANDDTNITNIDAIVNISTIEDIKQEIQSSINHGPNNLTFGHVYDMPDLDTAISFIQLNKHQTDYVVQSRVELMKPRSFFDAAFMGPHMNDRVESSILRSISQRYLLLLLVIDSSQPYLVSDRVKQSVEIVAKMFPQIVVACLDQSLHKMRADEMYNKFSQIRRISSINLPLGSFAQSTKSSNNQSTSDQSTSDSSDSLLSSNLSSSNESSQSSTQMSNECQSFDDLTDSNTLSNSSFVDIDTLLNTSAEANIDNQTLPSSDITGSNSTSGSWFQAIRNGFESIRLYLNQDAEHRPHYKRNPDRISLLVNRHVMIRGLPLLMLFTLNDGWMLDELIDNQLPTARRLAHKITQIIQIEPIRTDINATSQTEADESISASQTDEPVLIASIPAKSTHNLNSQLPWSMFGLLGWAIHEPNVLTNLFASIVQQPGLLFASCAIGIVHFLQMSRHWLDALEVDFIAEPQRAM